MRMNRCNQILKKAISLKESLEKFVGDANRLTDKLLELCNKPVQMHAHNILHEVSSYDLRYNNLLLSFKQSSAFWQIKKNLFLSFAFCQCVTQVDGNSITLSMSIHFKQLKRLVEEPTFSQILIPLQSVLIPTLPSTGGTNTQHDAFPGHWAYLDGFDDVVRETGGKRMSFLVFRLLA